MSILPARGGEDARSARASFVGNYGSTESRPTNAAVGSTVYQPVPSGNLPDGTAVTLENMQAFGAFERAPHSVGQVAQRDGLVARSTQPGGETVATARPSASDASTGLKLRG